MTLRNVAGWVAAAVLVLLCVQPVSGIPDAVSYEEYVTLIHDQGMEGGCIGYSMIHVLEIVKEREARYSPDPSYAYLNYIFWSATAGGTDGRVPHDPNMGGIPILKTYGACPETSYPTNFDILGNGFSTWLTQNPSNPAFDEAFAYRITGTIVNDTPTVAEAEECLATYGPLVCGGLFPGHVVALIGYNRTASEFTIIDSANWQNLWHAGVKKYSYADFASRQANIGLEAFTNRPTPLVHPYTARIRISHEFRRSFLRVKIGAVGHDPTTVWDRNNLYNFTDLGQNLSIDVPLPAYAADHWPPSEKDPWYVEVTNYAPGYDAVLEEVTLVRRYYPASTTGALAYEVYAQSDLPMAVPEGTVTRVLPLYGGLIRVQAEDYVSWPWGPVSEGYTYHDTTPGNSGGAYRDDDVDIAAFPPLHGRGYAVTDIEEGEYTYYSVMSPDSWEHDFPIGLRVAGWAADQTVELAVTGIGGSAPILVAVPNTGSNTSYAFANGTVPLRPGLNSIKFTYHGNRMNFDYFTIDPSGLTPAPPPTIKPLQTIPGALYHPLSLSVAGKFDDVNGNGRKDFADVVLYFNQMTWIAANEPVEGFDYNGNGRIDFADVGWLFNNL